MRNGRNAGDLSGKNVRQVRPRNAKVLSGGLDVHDFAMAECPSSTDHSAILPLQNRRSLSTSERRLFASEDDIRRPLVLGACLREVCLMPFCKAYFGFRQTSCSDGGTRHFSAGETASKSEI